MRNSDPSSYGKFIVQGPCGEKLCIVVSGADDDNTMAARWKHVSVSTRRRVPNWQEMCFVKDLFWDPKEKLSLPLLIRRTGNYMRTFIIYTESVLKLPPAKQRNRKAPHKKIAPENGGQVQGGP
jgi:hypothetical protein